MKKNDLKITCKYSYADKQWEKEFEDELYNYPEGNKLARNHSLEVLIYQYLTYNNCKVKIRCKDGCIQIERIK